MDVDVCGISAYHMDNVRNPHSKTCENHTYNCVRIVAFTLPTILCEIHTSFFTVHCTTVIRGW